MSWHLEEPDLSARLSPNGRTLRLYGLNSTAVLLKVKAGQAAFKPRSDRTNVYVFRDFERGATPEILNTKDEPQRVRVFEHSARLRGDSFGALLAPFSVTLYEIPVAGAVLNNAHKDRCPLQKRPDERNRCPRLPGCDYPVLSDSAGLP